MVGGHLIKGINVIINTKIYNMTRLILTKQIQ